MLSLRPLKSLLLAVFATLVLLGQCLAATVETRIVHSNAMNKDISANIIVPDSYSTSKDAYPVVYLLHGFGDNSGSWVQKGPVIVGLADLYQVIVVCPDGRDSWYLDAPFDPKYRYETYVSSEVVGFIDGNYRTIASPKGRAITGLSMGGHGAMFLALRHKDVFGAVGSMSGGLDIRPFPKNWNLSARLGTQEEHPEQWEAFTAINNLSNLKNGELAIIIDCGLKDFFLNVNRSFNEALIKQKIDHDYIERPGSHCWEYWGNSIRYQMLFFHEFFARQALAEKKAF